MSRTRRKHLLNKYHGYWLKEKDIGRDKKPGCKPPKWFKIMKRKIFRSKEKDAMIKGKELPIEKKTNQWEWT